MFLLPGDSPAGFRLPLGTLNHFEVERPFQRDPMTRPGPLGERAPLRQVPGRNDASAPKVLVPGQGNVFSPDFSPEVAVPDPATSVIASSDDWVAAGAPMWVEGEPIRTALSVEVRDGILHVFMPPTGSVEEYLDLAEAVQAVADEMDVVLRIEGYEPPRDSRVNVIRVTPDPGVIEVNIHPAHTWQGLRAITEALYEDARQCGLDSFTFMIDGRLAGSGGGNHIVVGGATPEDSPFLRRPDLLGSVVRYWQQNPSLSYLFSGTFIGPTSQAPRFDEGRPDAVYEMEIALAELARVQARGEAMPWLSDRIFRHLLTDLTGNTHRSEICIDKMFSPD
ncbi:MAG: transglutaminase family protein, partial [Dechloromonas sp.]|nr:transglutaminase family protein [Dechloromonas sp.]